MTKYKLVQWVFKSGGGGGGGGGGVTFAIIMIRRGVCLVAITLLRK